MERKWYISQVFTFKGGLFLSTISTETSHIPTFIRYSSFPSVEVPMVVNIDRLFSKRATRFRYSEIRELLKLTQTPGMISFAGGLPNPLAFPVGIVHE